MRLCVQSGFAYPARRRRAALRRKLGKSPQLMATQRPNPLAETVYTRLKAEIFDFRLLPGDRFTESEIAQRFDVSRTPVRDALYRLKHEGFVEVGFRAGWNVRQLDFARFDELYDLRVILECAAV